MATKITTKSIVNKITEKSHVTIVFEVKGKRKRRLIEYEVKKAIHKWNRLLDNELSYRIILVDCNDKHSEEYLFPIRKYDSQL